MDPIYKAPRSDIHQGPAGLWGGSGDPMTTLLVSEARLIHVWTGLCGLWSSQVDAEVQLVA